MHWNWSSFGKRFETPSGILELMDDLGTALASGDEALCMLGGGNPACVAEAAALFRDQWVRLSADPAKLDKVLGTYDTPQGSPEFLEALAEYLRAKFGWDISAGNVFVCNGSQTAFFYLFNLLAGGGKKILLPLSP